MIDNLIHMLKCSSLKILSCGGFILHFAKLRVHYKSKREAKTNESIIKTSVPTADTKLK